MRPVSRGITGLVLAGGQGSRMGGVDKGLQPLRGRPMIEAVLERLAPQVGPILINANRNIERYRAFGHPVIEDTIGGFAGPLAGFLAGLQACDTDWLVTCPCDSPYLPIDLVARLADALGDSGARIAVARAGGREQPVFALMRRSVRDDLRAFLEQGGRKIDRWYPALDAVAVDFDDRPDAFANLNSLDDLRKAESAVMPRADRR